ncbi:MAG: helix-turn-helix domain-containing protein [Anaerolineaceae bacterium]
MAEPRTYDAQQHCPVARTLDVVGDRWTVLLLRDLSWGRRKFSELLESLTGVSPNLLSDRLKKLEQSGMIERVFYSDHPPRAQYKLSAKGKAFVPVLAALREYGEQWEPISPQTTQHGNE